MHIITQTVAVGIGATAVMDLWGLVRQPLLGFPRADYRLVGRWFAHMPRGRFHHESIAKAAPIRGEHAIGWIAHYSIGVSFAALLVLCYGPAWLEAPTLGPALLIGLVTLAGPMLVMQPAMGAGIAASRTPRPNAARLQSLLTHLVFGLGLHAAALVLHLITTKAT